MSSVDKSDYPTTISEIKKKFGVVEQTPQEMEQTRLDLLASLTEGLTEEEARGITEYLEKSKNLTYEELYPGAISPFYFYPLGSNLERPSSQHSKKLYELTRQLTRFKYHLLANYHQPSLLSSVQEVISLITCYRKNTRELPFHWLNQKFLAEEHRGAKLYFPPGLSLSEVMCTQPKIIHEESDDEEDECLQDPWWTAYRHKIHNTTMHENIIDPWRLHGNYSDLLEGHGKQIWQKFKKLNKGLCEFGDYKFIEVDRPIVSVVGNFVVASFKKRLVLKSRLMECRFCKGMDGVFIFNMIIEVTRKRIALFYVAEVVCRTSDDSCSLLAFEPTYYSPIDTGKVVASYLSCLESICEAVDALSEEKIKRLRDLYDGLGGDTFRQGVTAGCDWDAVEHAYRLTKEGLCSRIDKDMTRHLQSMNNSGLVLPSWERQSSSKEKTKLCKQASLSKEMTKLWKY